MLYYVLFLYFSTKSEYRVTALFIKFKDCRQIDRSVFFENYSRDHSMLLYKLVSPIFLQ